ncbi:helix-turn-helix domain-containing protein [Micrococcales bacterium 31B]|nr:helix-turn-helix domain-containing protein [Micrococcales bacterium 31B]
MPTFFSQPTEQFLTPEAQAEARELAKKLVVAHGVDIVSDEGVTRIGADLMSALTRLVGSLAEGRAVTIGAAPAEITTTTAAQLLGVSRPTVMKMIEGGVLSSRKVGAHNRLTTSEVIALRLERLAARRAEMESLREFEDALGL